jgi:Phytanoyl-CoA dioxygenase (PhyH)
VGQGWWIGTSAHHKTINGNALGDHRMFFHAVLGSGLAARGACHQVNLRCAIASSLACMRLAGVDAECLARIAGEGWSLVPDVLSGPACEQLIEAIGRPAGSTSRGGVRGMFAFPAVSALARSALLRALIEPVLGPHAFAVRATMFDKVPAANWRLPWHRDRLVAVRSRLDVPGFTAWSVKAGVVHVEPPLALLGRMLALRLHLDDIDHGNGPLRLIPGSHRESEDQPVDVAAAVTITAARGSVLLMRPFVRHASVPATVPCHRRILHFEFATDELPGGLEWHEKW